MRLCFTLPAVYLRTVICKIWVLIWFSGDTRCRSARSKREEKQSDTGCSPPCSLARHFRQGLEASYSSASGLHTVEMEVCSEAAKRWQNTKIRLSQPTLSDIPLQWLKYLASPSPSLEATRAHLGCDFTLPHLGWPKLNSCLTSSQWENNEIYEIYGWRRNLSLFSSGFQPHWYHL